VVHDVLRLKLRLMMVEGGTAGGGVTFRGPVCKKWLTRNDREDVRQQIECPFSSGERGSGGWGYHLQGSPR
jgi:hypothetical protein